MSPNRAAGSRECRCSQGLPCPVASCPRWGARSPRPSALTLVRLTTRVWPETVASDRGSGLRGPVRLVIRCGESLGTEHGPTHRDTDRRTTNKFGPKTANRMSWLVKCQKSDKESDQMSESDRARAQEYRGRGVPSGVTVGTPQARTWDAFDSQSGTLTILPCGQCL